MCILNRHDGQVSFMNIRDLFIQEGVRFPLDGSKPQPLDDPRYVWMVERGKIAVFLSTIDSDQKTGIKTFLFDAQPGDWLFGMSPEGLTMQKSFLASGLIGSSILRLEINRLPRFIGGHAKEQRISEEITKAIEHWLQTLDHISRNQGHAQDTIIEHLTKVSQEEIASAAEAFMSEYEYLTDPSLRTKYNAKVLRSAIELWESQLESEKKRLINKTKLDQRLMANSISKLASITEKKKIKVLEESTGDPLLDACRLIGQSMKIQIVVPTETAVNNQGGFDLEAIVRASRVRIREVTLNGQWYKQDSGPFLGYMKEDYRPIALVPASPTKYELHDFTLGLVKLVDQDTAAEINPLAFIFYRPFPEKVITLIDIMKLGWESNWKRDFLMIALMGVLGGILGTAIPLATGIIFNTIIPEGEKGQLIQIAFFLGSSALATMIFQFVRGLATLRIEGNLEGSIQASIWDRLLSLPVPFFKQFSAGELAMRAMGISQIRKILSGTTLNAILTSIFSIFNMVLMFYYDIHLAGIAALIVAVQMLVMGGLGYSQVRYERKILAVSNYISGMLLQFIGGITKFRVAGAERRAFYRWAKEFSEQRQMVYKRRVLGNYQTTFNTVFSILSSMAIFYALTKSSGTLSPGEFIGFNSAFVTFMISMMVMSESIIGANIVIPLYQRAKPILETLPECDENKITPQPLKGAIEVDHVSFRYKENGPLALKDVSCQINEGDYVALVGTSGCGKSTLLRILLGFEKPETGKVYYDGQDLSKVDVRAIRRQLGVVLQNGQLMSGNIFTNIIGANPYLNLNDAWEAARMAGIEEDIKAMPMGMHTMISEGASTISGGQKQRLMIARAIVNKPKILFFDEATSALDNRTQAIVSQSLDQLQATRIVIAHRLSTIINCNKIIVMDQGKIVESGTYEELIKNNGVFATLVQRQLT